MVKDAKISTLGEEANDIFIVVPTNKNTGFGKDINSIKSNLKQKISELYN
jgi:UTP:GlnB (protein PII) uridylyltransferase